MGVNCTVALQCIVQFICIVHVDQMSDRDYMRALACMELEDKLSLMCSEAERLRTYNTWPRPEGFDNSGLAKEGFYYTGM